MSFFMVDSVGKRNILHYGSNKCQLIAHSVMGAEVHALVHGFDYKFIVRDLINEL